MKAFKDIKIGDNVIVHDNRSAHNYTEHTLKVTSINNNNSYKTKTNPTGMHAYGIDLDFDDEEHRISKINENNFVCFPEDKIRLGI